jgi:uncharacterized protein (DUF4213/DUF364 family)
MTIKEEYLILIEKILTRIPLPAISSIHLPALKNTNEHKDEFGFIFLEDGSAGPFYTSLGNTLNTFWKRQNKGELGQHIDLPTLFASDNLADHALALGTFNALSSHLMKRANYQPTQNRQSTGNSQPAPGERIGMVGYFCPLVDKLLEQGCEVVVIEQQPERVEFRKGVTVSTNPASLAPCKTILCTGSTLINNSLDEILAAATNAQSFNLIGPSSSGLPDVLFAHGVTATGGVHFDDIAALQTALDNQESWGKAGEKYQLTPSNYPGVEDLLERIPF